MVPDLLAQTGVGPISAAQIYCSWSHRERLRSDAAFAMLAGAAPIPASSGQTVRHRLNRGGDRQLNCALHTIVLCRLKHDPATRAYAARRLAEGKTPREIKRCLKRYLSRRLFRILQNHRPRYVAAGGSAGRTAQRSTHSSKAAREMRSREQSFAARSSPRSIAR